MVVLNVTQPVTKNGHHYPGYTVYPGVTAQLVPYENEDAPDGTKQIVFENADPETVPSMILFDAGASADFSENACPHYLAIHSAV